MPGWAVGPPGAIPSGRDYVQELKRYLA